MKKVFLLILFLTLLKVSIFGAFNLGTLTTPNTTSAINIEVNEHHSFQYVTTGVSTNVVLRPEGSLDGTNWFPLDDLRQDTTITANGTFMDHKANFTCEQVRVTWVSKSGTGTTPNVAIKYFGR